MSRNRAETRKAADSGGRGVTPLHMLLNSPVFRKAVKKQMIEEVRVACGDEGIICIDPAVSHRINKEFG